MRAIRLSLLIALALMSSVTAAAKQTGLWEREKSRLAQEWSGYTHWREKRSHDLHACRERATAEHVAQTARAEFVHRCAKAH